VPRPSAIAPYGTPRATLSADANSDSPRRATTIDTREGMVEHLARLRTA
jgi:hypothetical protein